MLRSNLRELLLRIPAPLWFSPTGVMIDGLPRRVAAWLFTETPSETIRRRLWEMSRTW